MLLFQSGAAASEQCAAALPQAYPILPHPPHHTRTHAHAHKRTRAVLQVGNARYATGRYLEAGYLFKLMVNSAQLPDFLTLPALDILIATEWGPGVGTGAARSKL